MNVRSNFSRETCGMTLSLLARYFHYTSDGRLLLKHRAKIEATAKQLSEMHDEGLRLPKDNPAYGLIRGWSESDSCLSEHPALYWQAYYANGAFAARGFKDLAAVWKQLGQTQANSTMQALAEQWLKRSKTLQEQTARSVEANIQRDKTPPYIGIFPGTTLTFRESLETERPSPQQWPHRPYAELLQADILPAKLANLVIDCMVVRIRRPPMDVPHPWGVRQFSGLLVWSVIRAFPTARFRTNSKRPIR